MASGGDECEFLIAMPKKKYNTFDKRCYTRLYKNV
jgi:hypothetical protein